MTTARARLKSKAIALTVFFVVAGCRSHDTPISNINSPQSSTPAPSANPPTATASTAPALKSKVDVCNLLTSDEVKSVQGEAYKQAQRSDRRDGDFIVAQCYYTLPTLANSVVLNVTTAREESGARSPRDFWEKAFDEGAEEKGSRYEEKEEESGPPQKVRGVGDEAFWISGRVGGVLYVLKKDVFFRISIGGAADDRTKLSRSKTLAQQVLKRI